jgi:hypothetical protein
MRSTLPIVVGLIVVLMHGGLACAAQVVALDVVAVVEAQTAGCHALNAVALNDAKRLVVQGSVCMKKTFALHHLTQHGRFVIANLWTEVEVYDFADPKRPQLVRSLTLDETHPRWGGGGLVKEEDTLLVLGTTVSAEVSMSGAPSEWRVRNLDVTPELKRRTERLYSTESRQKDPADLLGGDPRVVPLEGGRFEVRWDTSRPRRGVVRHRQYLRALESGATLLIDTHDETID